MSDFEKWFAGYHSNNEAYAETIARDAWNARQSEIDQLKAEKEKIERKLRLCEVLRNNQFEHLLDVKAQFDSLRVENGKLKAEKEGLEKVIQIALFEMRQKSLLFRDDMDGYKDPAQICQSEGIDIGVNILEKALRGEHE